MESLPQLFFICFSLFLFTIHQCPRPFSPNPKGSRHPLMRRQNEGYLWPLATWPGASHPGPIASPNHPEPFVLSPDMVRETAEAMGVLRKKFTSKGSQATPF